MTDVEALLSARSCKQRELTKIGAELEALLNRPSQKEVQDKQQFKSKGGKSAVKEFCTHGTREQCRAERMLYYSCEKVHFRKLLQAHTDESLGDCSYLNACRHMHTCKFVHYDIDPEQDEQPFQSRHPRHALRLTQASKEDTEWNDNDYAQKYGAQWINTDIRKFKYPLLGHFSVIMADPPWHIHMDLPYGTMSDEEMLGMRMAELQNDGVMLLWVTGRAMELGRDCLEHWGYECAGEILWVKTNQLQRLIRTGRTGHWLNHSKEHCLIGIKGDPKIHHNIDCDVIVAEVRETSRKPDEIYNILERLSPGTRKLEIFGRPHNTRPGWITLGNQVDGTKLTDPGIIQRFRSEYPDVEINTVKSKGGLDPAVANKPPPPPPPQANYPHNHKPKSTVVAVSTGDKTVVPLSRTKNNAQATTNVIISSLVPKS